MTLPADLRSRQLELASRMTLAELEALPLPPETTDRLRRLLSGVAAAAAELCAELAPRPRRASVTTTTAPAETCAVFDLRTRRRVA